LENNDLHQFKEGEVIFREGEDSKAAYVLMDGHISLTKEGDKGPVTLALLHPGELFGEMSLLDEGPRSATARAIGEVQVRIIPRSEFLHALENEPETARSVMGKLVERLRVANDMVVHGAPPAPPAPSTPPVNSPISEFFARLFGIGGPARPQRIEVRIAGFAADSEDGKNVTRILRALDKRRGIRARALGEILELDDGQDLIDDLATQIPTAAARGRGWLARANADILIWGEIPLPGTTIRLRFLSRNEESEDGPGMFGLAISLNLPVDFAPEFDDLLYAIVLAATVPTSEGKAMTLRECLPKALETAFPVYRQLPSDLTTREKASVDACIANVILRTGALPGGGDPQNEAIVAYRSALESVTREDEPLEWGLMLRNLGVLLQAQADRGGDVEALEAAADAFRNALQVIPRERFPKVWAAIQNRIGLVLYRLDMKTGDTELVKHALSAYQSALQVYTRVAAPMRWAEVMTNFAQAALMLGEQMRNDEVLEKAADACRSALQVRTRENAPLAWAATQNNLGSALFLLGKSTSDRALIDGAAHAFTAARDVYREHGAARTLAVAERNLGRVQALLDKLGAKSIPKMTWEEDQA
jgi:CRP-like cAMP-binding protein